MVGGKLRGGEISELGGFSVISMSYSGLHSVATVHLFRCCYSLSAYYSPDAFSRCRQYKREQNKSSHIYSPILTQRMKFTSEWKIHGNVQINYHCGELCGAKAEVCGVMGVQPRGKPGLGGCCGWCGTLRLPCRTHHWIPVLWLALCWVFLQELPLVTESLLIQGALSHIQWPIHVGRRGLLGLKHGSPLLTFWCSKNRPSSRVTFWISWALYGKCLTVQPLPRTVSCHTPQVLISKVLPSSLA